MAKKATPKATPTCTMCGKTLPVAGIAGATCGALCAKRQAQGYTPAKYVAHRATVSATTAPAGYITIANLHRWLASNQQYGCTIGKMVTAIGGDRALSAPVHPICQPVYIAGQRYVHGWLGTQAGAQAMATGNFSKAPAFTPVKLGLQVQG